MLSIIIITKNEEICLPDLLQSIQRQKLIDYEIIVSDAKSTDKTRDIAKKYKCKVTDGGVPSVGRNNGAKIAKYDYLLFLDADVVLPNNFLLYSINEFFRRKLDCATVIYKPITNKIGDKILYILWNMFALITKSFYPHSAGICIFCKKYVFNAVNGFDEKIVMAEDMDFVKRVNKLFKFDILLKCPILCNVRRLRKEGRLQLIKKYTINELHRIFKGELYECPTEYELQGRTKIKSKNGA